ncbi:hypothetical protein [Tautonia plasticadhaerens]|uniref:Uncharacterized protein n=1 Tax=Tautonia plasticadhaerens TaxID=2527974 RepID=A0A518H824_9BACT|nr:hypothetical protein [Tautonia plasticadhaerens]QDV37018.1 hypothetical protein ElP_49510 [Tautonia plasticadhaerens]
MFWKLAFTVTVVLLIAGRSSTLRNPLVRLILPRSWVAALSALPARRAGEAARSGASPPSPGRNWFDRRARFILIVIVLSGVAALLATRAMISNRADAAAGPIGPRPGVATPTR